MTARSKRPVAACRGALAILMALASVPLLAAEGDGPGMPARGPTGELAGHRLLLTSIRTGDTEVFVVDPETGDAFNVSRSPRSEDRYPCWSPDGRRIAFTSDRDRRTNLYVVRSDGRGLKRVVDSKAVCYMPSWQKTPHGERIVFGLHGERPEMASVRPDGGDLRVLGAGHDPCLSPDGRHIAYTGEAPGGVTVFVMNHDGTGTRQLVPDASRPGAVFPNWSPDGRQIVYSWPVGEALELFVIGLDGSGNRQLTRTGGICTPAAWSPDGTWISFRFTNEAYWRTPARAAQVYAERPASKRPVWVIHPDGTGAHPIECLRFQCAIDGSRAAWKPQARRAPTPAARPAEAGFVPLFSDQALPQWRQCGPGRFVVADGVASGEGGMGLWWYAGGTFTNFVLRGEFVQEQEGADSGVFLRFPDPGQDPWLAVKQGHEMEIGDPAPQDPTWRTGSIYPFAASTRANTKAPGQWNSFEIVCRGQEYLVRINGELVTRWADPSARTSHGFVGLQNYNDHKTVRHRNLRIERLP